jgi:hypothetical protein
MLNRSLSIGRRSKLAISLTAGPEPCLVSFGSMESIESKHLECP